jgi:hypothetical protein
MIAARLLALVLAVSLPVTAAEVPPWEKYQRAAGPTPYTAGDFEKGCALVDLAITSPERLSNADRAAANACTFYFLGVTESLSATSHLGARVICPPEAALRTSDIVEKFQAFVRQNPESRTVAAMPVTIAALMQAYPCVQ